MSNGRPVFLANSAIAFNFVLSYFHKILLLLIKELKLPTIKDQYTTPNIIHMIANIFSTDEVFGTPPYPQVVKIWIHQSTQSK